MDKCPKCGWTPDPEYIPANCPELLKTLRRFAQDPRFVKEFDALTNIWAYEFPDCDLEKELRRAHEWIERRSGTKPNERYDFSRFLTNWFFRSQERAGLKVPRILELPEKDRPRADLMQRIRVFKGRYVQWKQDRYNTTWIGLHTFREFIPFTTLTEADLQEILTGLESGKAPDAERHVNIPPSNPVLPARNPASLPPPAPRAQPTPAPKPQSATWDEAKPIPLTKGNEYDFPANADDVPF